MPTACVFGKVPESNGKFLLKSANGINANGLIVGYGNKDANYGSTGNHHAFLLTPQ
jgi:hypothetical protein